MRLFHGLSIPTLLGLTALAVIISIGQKASVAQPASSNEPEGQSIPYADGQQNSTCYEVAAEAGVYVREAPTVYSEAIAVLNAGQRVTSTVVQRQPRPWYGQRAIGTAAQEQQKLWVPITSPINGYVFNGFLESC